MARMRAAVLAAGRGVRMGGRDPKTLLPVADHPLLLYILRALAHARIDDLLVVTGYKPELVQRFVEENWTGEATSIRNPRYASWGNFHSLRLAIDQSPGYDLLVVNSDVVIAPDVYSRVASSDGDLVLAVQRRYDLDTEDMRVQLDGRTIRAVSKQLRRSHSHAEFCGVSLIRPDAAARYAEQATRVEWIGDTDAYYEDIYNAILAFVDARAVLVGRDDYAEVDVPDDVPAAESVIRRYQDAWGTDTPVEPAAS